MLLLSSFHLELKDTYKLNPDVVILYIATDKIYEEFLDLNVVLRESFADDYCKKIVN